MRDGCGNDYSIVFSPAGAYARGFDHESPMSPYRVTPPVPWPGLFDGAPEAFLHHVAEQTPSGGLEALRPSQRAWGTATARNGCSTF